jgi:hypothetical protein
MATPCKDITLVPPFAESNQLLTFQQATGTRASTMDSIRKSDERQRVRVLLYEPDLKAMHSLLGYAGRKGDINTLHHQIVLRREIILTEAARLHLVWYQKTIYIQRLSDELLSWDYFSDVICGDKETYEAATGFLFTYMRLIEFPSDLKIAQKAGLVSELLSWERWERFRTDVLHTLALRNVRDRYEYGELRLGRLNSVFRLKGFGLTYFSVYRDYLSYFGENYTGLVALFALVSVALSAMQVMIGFKDVPTVATTISYGFAAAILSALAMGFAFLFGSCVGLCVWNWCSIYIRRRLRNS